MSKNMRLQAITFMVMCFLFGIEDKTSGVTKEEIEAKGFLPSLTEYCSTFKMGQVKSQAAITKINNPADRAACERELANARQTLLDIALFCRCLRGSSLSVKEKVESLRLLSDLQAKVLNRAPIGVGNIEIACSLSMLISGVFFDLYSNVDLVTKRSMLCAFEKNGEFNVELVRNALKADILMPSAGKENANLCDEVIKLAFGGQMAGQELAGTPLSTLDKLAKDLQNQVAKAGFADQLNEPNAKWIAWDIIWALRLHALCRISLYLPVSPAQQSEESHRQFMAFQAAISNELSEVQRNAIGASIPATCSGIKRDAYLLIDVRERVSAGGHRIFDMLCHRLKCRE